MEISKLVCGNCKLRNERNSCFWSGTGVEPERLSCFRLYPPTENFEDRGYFNKQAREVEEGSPYLTPEDYKRIVVNSKRDQDLLDSLKLCECESPKIDQRKTAKMEVSLTGLGVKCWCRTCGHPIREYQSPSTLPKALKERYVEAWALYDPKT